MLKAHLLDPPTPEATQVLRDALDPSIILTLGPLPDPTDFDILIAGRPTREQLSASSDLRILIVPWAGIPPATLDLLSEFPSINLHNLHHNAALTAEMAVALLLAAAKRIVPCDRALRDDDWSPRYAPIPSLLLDGKTALVLGFGQIGRRIARACHGLGMQVIAIRRDPSMPVETDFPVEVHGPDQLHALLPRAHALLIALPATADTEGMIGADELILLPEGAVLVNVGRGTIVDQHALYRALREGPLGAAGLDVWYNYPASREARTSTPPADVPFGALDNVVLSPHRAGASTETEPLRMRHLAALLNAAARGEAVPNRVDPAAGY